MLRNLLSTVDSHASRVGKTILRSEQTFVNRSLLQTWPVAGMSGKLS
jgi:hypothetical protein